jgi:hypothetical protein
MALIHAPNSPEGPILGRVRCETPARAPQAPPLAPLHLARLTNPAFSAFAAALSGGVRCASTTRQPRSGRSALARPAARSARASRNLRSDLQFGLRGPRENVAR